jgi:VIT1/CCC1 family predicted Fe2+/Mn2+ transporter
MAITNGLAGRNLGMVLLGLWLILTGLLPLLNVRLSSTVTTGLAVLAILAGILILLKR